MHNKLIGVCRRTLPSCIPRRITKFDIDYNNNNTLLHTLVPFVVIHSRTSQFYHTSRGHVQCRYHGKFVVFRVSPTSFIYSLTHSLIYTRIHTPHTHTFTPLTQYICMSHNLSFLFFLFFLSIFLSFSLFPPSPVLIFSMYN